MKKKLAAVILSCAIVFSGCGGANGTGSGEAEAPAGAETEETGTEESGTEMTDGEEEVSGEESGRIGNGLFAFEMPEEYAGAYETETGDDYIYIYHKASKEAGYGGYIFGVRAYEKAEDYAGGPFTKIGELDSGSGTHYDLVRWHASEFQTDTEPDSGSEFWEIYDRADEILETLESEDGGEFSYGKGTRGGEFYGEDLSRLVTGLREGWDASAFEEAGMSSMYAVIRDTREEDVFDNVGCLYKDVNNDGVEEFLIGEIADGDWKGIIYDLYTVVDGKSAHVFSGWDRDRYFLGENGLIIREYSGGAAESGWLFYSLETNNASLVPQVGFKVDEYEDEDHPWYVSYDFEEDEPKWESIEKEEFDDRLELMAKYDRLDYTPLSQFQGEETAAASEGEAALPEYEYPGPELFYSVVYDYIRDEFGAHYDKADVGIPCVRIVDLDESDPEDNRLYGDFWYFNYTLKGDTLETASGGSYPGVMHIKCTDEGYEVTGMDVVADGTDYLDSAKKIFGDKFEAFQKLSSDDEDREKTRAQIIANYVAANHLPIKKYQDYGWDPVELPEENIDSFYSQLD